MHQSRERTHKPEQRYPDNIPNTACGTAGIPRYPMLTCQRIVVVDDGVNIVGVSLEDLHMEFKS